MRKAEIIAAISDETCIPRDEIEVTLEAFFKILKHALIIGETVRIRGCGAFIIGKQAYKNKSLKCCEGTVVELTQ